MSHGFAECDGKPLEIKGNRLQHDRNMISRKMTLSLENTGAPGRVRTRDPLITNQVLYQLSYKGNP